MKSPWFQWGRNLLWISAIFTFILACSLLSPQGDQRSQIETAVAATLTAFSPTWVATSTLPPPSPTNTKAPTATPANTPTITPPPSGLSLNCDGTYQRFRLIDEGIEGRTIYVDNWVADSWVEVWNLKSGDPMVRQIEEQAGVYQFGECEKLLLVPLRYAGSGAVLELKILKWDGENLRVVYAHDGIGGMWEKRGDTIVFRESLYLYGEPNCCPCNIQILEHTWDGESFYQSGSLIKPTYEGDPPAHCRP